MKAKQTCKQCGSPYHSKMSCKDNPVAVAKAAATKKRMQDRQRLKASTKPIKRPVGASKVKKVKTPTQNGIIDSSRLGTANIDVEDEPLALTGGFSFKESQVTVLSKKIRHKTCVMCSGKFSTYNTVQKYCSLPCAKKARHVQTIAKTKTAQVRNIEKFKKEHGNTAGKMVLKCANCKGLYDVYAAQVKARGSKYCSLECKRVGQTLNKPMNKLVKELDAVYSRYIRHKDATDGMVECVTCGKVDEIKNMQHGHYVSRVYRSTRWLDKNSHVQCYRCNVALSGNYAVYTLFMIKTYGADVIEELVTLSKQSPKYSKVDILEKIEYYRGKVAELLAK